MEHGQDNNDVTLLCLKIRQPRPRFYLMIDDVAPKNNRREQIIVFTKEKSDRWSVLISISCHL